MPRTAVVLAAAALAAASPAAAYMAPEVYVRMRAAADFHVQVVIGFVAPPAAPDRYGTCLVSGSVVSVFRARDDGLARGDSVTFGVPCLLAGPAAVPVGGTAYSDVEWLRRARAIEVFLSRGADGLAVADQGDGVRLLDAPTAEPTVIDRPR